jgi:hypothetical protein
MPALVISANLPDIDSFVAPWFGTTSRTFHRGFTHGVGGLVVMPFLAMAMILLWKKLRPGKEGSVKLFDRSTAHDRPRRSAAGLLEAAGDVARRQARGAG